MLRRMSRRPPPPRPISPDEIELVRRVIETGADPVLTEALLRDLDALIVRDSLHGSLDFGSEGRDSVIVAGALGRLDDGREMEILIWAEGSAITHLQVSPHLGTPGRARLPPVDAVYAYPPDAHGNDED